VGVFPLEPVAEEFAPMKTPELKLKRPLESTGWMSSDGFRVVIDEKEKARCERARKTKRYLPFALYCLVLSGVVMLFLLAGAFADTPDPAQPATTMTALERSALIADLRAENRALKQQVAGMSRAMEELAQGHITNWVREGMYDFAVFAEERCFSLVHDPLLENQCVAFVIYTEEVQHKYGLESQGQIDWSEEKR
jgi:hypothetical protein